MIPTPALKPSHDGQMLIVDRFDLNPRRGWPDRAAGFEDIVSLMNLRVRDVLSERKYRGSYQRIGELLRYSVAGRGSPAVLRAGCLSVMVRNGDAHLKKLRRACAAGWHAEAVAMFDVVTTAVYT